MARQPTPLTDAQRAAKLAELQRDMAQRQADYRARALKLFPHLCASCGREFEGRRLKELTVHHKDHNHHNNPPDGSNWELLCIYCHDHEHEKTIDAKFITASSTRIEPKGPGLASPFDQLGALLGNPEP